jgi:hypothetical protein
LFPTIPTWALIHDNSIFQFTRSILVIFFIFSYGPSWTLVFRCRFCDSALSSCLIVVHSIQNLTKWTTQP